MLAVGAEPLHGCVQKSVSKSWEQFYVVVFSHHQQAASGHHAITGRVILLNVIHKMSLLSCESVELETREQV